MPEHFLEKIKKNISPQWKICFLSAVIFGLIAHLYKIMNWLPNWDSLVFRYDAQNMTDMGRWFLGVVCAPGSFYDLPAVAGFLAVIFHALGAVCICKMFDVKKNVTAALIGASVAVFPTVTSVMMYNYVADGYAFAFFLSCVAAILATKEKPCYIASAVLIAFSCGIYQAYITVTIMLILLRLINDLISGETDAKKSLFKSLKLFITGVAGMGLYYAILIILLKATNTVLLDYQGFKSAVSFAGIDILGALYVVKNNFMDYFFDCSKAGSVFFITNCIVFAVTIILYAAEALKNKISFVSGLLLCFYVALLPIGSSVLAFINNSIDYHNLMKMGFFVFYLFFILQYEKSGFKCEKDNIFKAWVILGVTSIIIFNNIVTANVGDHKLTMAYEKSYGTLVRIADRIEQTEGASECDSIAVLGELDGSEKYSANLPPDITGTTDGYILRADDEIVSQSVLCSALNDYCGKDYKFLAGEEKKAMSEKAEGFDCWPAKDSICVIDGVIVIKLSDEVTK